MSSDLPGIGPKNADMMIIAERPTKTETEVFDGRGGRYIKKNVMKPLLIDPEEVYVTYATWDTDKEKLARQDAIKNRDNLIREIQEVQPKVIIGLGNIPLVSLLFLDKASGISVWRGRPLYSSELKAWIVMTYDAKTLSMGRKEGSWFWFDQTIEDFKLAMQLVDTPPPKVEYPDLPLIQDPELAKKWIVAGERSGFVALDLETDGFDPRNDILGLSITFKDKKGNYHPAYIDWSVIDENLEVSDALHRLCMSTQVDKVFHNSSFDVKYLYFHGFPMDGAIHDTMLMAHLLDENFSVGLKQRTWVELPGYGGYDIPLEQYKVENKFTKNSSYAEIPVDVMTPYAAMDTLVTYKLYELFVPKLEEQDLWPVYSKIMMPVRGVMTQAEINGIYVDMKTADVLDKRITKVKEYLEYLIYETAGRQFNFTSTVQLSYVLFEEMGAPGRTFTNKGNVKCDKAVLQGLAERDPKKKWAKLSHLVLRYKYMDKLQGTYIGQAKKFVWDDGRIHSSYNATGTATGRTSNSKPCTHNIPKDRLIRSLYRASPGQVIVEADIKAAEMRTIAVASGDETLLKIIRSGGDIHNMTYNEMFDMPEDYVPSQAERRIAKSINFGLIFGITAIGLARRLNLSVKEAQTYIDTYFHRFSGVAKWIQRTVKIAREMGYVESLFKRRRRLLEINHDNKYSRWRAERQAMNSPIQSAAADYTYVGLIRVEKMLRSKKLKAKVIHTVHDCVLVDTPKEEVDVVKRIIEKAFLTPVKAFPMEMDIDIEVNEQWGEHNDSPLEELLEDIEKQMYQEAM